MANSVVTHTEHSTPQTQSTEHIHTWYRIPSGLRNDDDIVAKTASPILTRTEHRPPTYRNIEHIRNTQWPRTLTKRSNDILSTF